AHGDVTDTKVAGYVAKYATKAAECTGTLDRRITPADRLADLPVREHARRHISACIRLGKLPHLKDLRLAPWAPLLRFPPPFSPKPRGSSPPLAPRGAARPPYQREPPPAAGLHPALAPGPPLGVPDWHSPGGGAPPDADLPLPGEARRAPAPDDRTRSRRGA